MKKFFMLVMVIMMLAGTAACGTSAGGEEAQAGKAEANPYVIEPVKEYYELDERLEIPYAYPNRPFDSRMTVEGVGKIDGKFSVIMNVKSYQKFFVTIPMAFYPVVTYKGKEYSMVDREWAESSQLPYNYNNARFAVSSKTLKLPKGEMPDSIKIAGKEVKLPETWPKPVTLEGKRGFAAELKKLDVSVETHKNRTYTLKSLEDGVLSAEVDNHDEERRENLIYLLQDDKKRTYSFKRNTVPARLEPGKTAMKLELQEQLPEDIGELYFVIFEPKISVTTTYIIEHEKKVRIY